MNEQTLEYFKKLSPEKQEQLISLMLKILAFHRLDSDRLH